MPVLKSSKKALKVSKRRKKENDTIKSKIRQAQKAVSEKPTKDTVSQAFSTIDRAVKKHLIHKNRAARLKSQLSKLLTK